jgi:phage baseplate assembly protein W
MATRADKYTQAQKQEWFSDFLNNFDNHPINHSLTKVTNERSVSQSIKNLILTDLGERLFQPTIGSDIRKTLFDPNDIVTAENITFFIKSTVRQNEPRATLLDVIVTANPDGNSFSVSVVYSLINNNVPITLNLLLKRVR